MDKRISDLLGKRAFLRTRDMVEAGIDRRVIARAVRSGDLVNPAISAAHPEHGIFCARGTDNDPDHNEALVMFLFGGKAVFGMQYAAMRQGLATGIPETMQVFVPYEVVLGPRDYLKVTRTRRREALEVGVVEVPTALGVPVRITSPARTVVDLLRNKDRNVEDWRHGIDALKTYFETGGDTGELMEVASAFDRRLPDIVETAIQTYAPGGPTP